MHNDMQTTTLIHSSLIVQMGHKTLLSPLGQKNFILNGSFEKHLGGV